MIDSPADVALQARLLSAGGVGAGVGGKPQDVADAGRQFESVLIKTMLDSAIGGGEARDEGADDDPGLLDNDGVRTYRAMLAEQLASDMSRHVSLGLVAAMERQAGEAKDGGDLDLAAGR